LLELKPKIFLPICIKTDTLCTAIPFSGCTPTGTLLRCHYSNRGKPRLYEFKEAKNLNGNFLWQIFRPSKTPSQLYWTNCCLHRGFPLFTSTPVTSLGKTTRNFSESSGFEPRNFPKTNKLTGFFLNTTNCDLRLPLWRNWDLPYSGTLHVIDWLIYYGKFRYNL